VSAPRVGGEAGEPGESTERQELRRRAQALGLSSTHISSRQRPGSIRVFLGGRQVVLRGDPIAAIGSGRRRRVHGFTRASRRRMLQWLQTIDREDSGLPLFVTLTYPREWPGDSRRWKRDLNAWLARLKRAQPRAWAVWRLEPQARGAPHYHLLVFGVDALPKEWLSRTWYEVVGSRDERHLRAGTQVQRVRSWNGVTSYAAKYLAKELVALPHAWQQGVGRWWGVHNRRRVPRQAMDVRLTDGAFCRIRRVMRRYVRRAGGRNGRPWRDPQLGADWFLRCGDRMSLPDSVAIRLLEWATGGAPAEVLALPAVARDG
jgi:hypothetical protein